jgi:hypothetical protein
MTIVLSILLFVMFGVAYYFGAQVVASRRRAYIRGFEFPMGLFERLRKQHPELDLKQCQLVAQALRQFFLAHLKSGRRFVAMPSQAADDLWHEFILYTRNYDAFCRQAFGRFMHHTPAVVMGSDRQANAGLRRCWWFICKEENINPRQPTRMPLLFALDAKLGVANGFRYVPDCGSVKRQGAGSGCGGGTAVHCCNDFGNASFAGGSEGFGDVGSSDSGGTADGGGDSGSGCGGGGCGGGGSD